MRAEASARTGGWSKEPGAIPRQCASKASIHQGSARQHVRIQNGRGGIIAQAAHECAVYVDFISDAQLNCKRVSGPLLQGYILFRE